jgi:hypothetical protein
MPDAEPMSKVLDALLNLPSLNKTLSPSPSLTCECTRRRSSFDYQPGNGVNSDIFLSLGLVPENVTFGFNYTAGRYPMCSSLTGLATPTCYCHTAECTVASESSASFPEWTLTSTMTFSSNANQFTGGVTPTTDHHSPRISLPPIVYVPYMKPDENTTFFLSASAVDEVKSVSIAPS